MLVFLRNSAIVSWRAFYIGELTIARNSGCYRKALVRADFEIQYPGYPIILII